MEVTKDHEVVWEYVNPYGNPGGSMIYRAYRVPYEWVPVPKPTEVPVEAIDNNRFRMPGAAPWDLSPVFEIGGCKERAKGVKSTPLAPYQQVNAEKLPHVFEIEEEKTPVLTRENKAQFQKDCEGTVVALFGARRCENCKQFYPEFLKAEEKMTEKSKASWWFVRVDAEAELAKECEVTATPTVVVWKDGSIKEKLAGVKTAEEVMEFLNKTCG